MTISQHIWISWDVEIWYEKWFLLFQTILTPQNSFYEKLAKECVENGVAVDLFLFPNAYIDVATIGSVATLTGGQIYRYSYFKVLLVWAFLSKLMFILADIT